MSSVGPCTCHPRPVPVNTLQDLVQMPGCMHALQCCCCRCDEAIVDLEAAQHVYIALGHQAKGRTLEDDIAKIKQLQASMKSRHRDA